MTDDEKRSVLALSLRDQIIENFREHKEAIDCVAKQNSNKLLKMMAVFIQAEIMPKVET